MANLNVYLGADLKKKLEEFSKKTERNKSYFVKKALEYFFENNDIDDFLTDEQWYLSKNIDIKKEEFVSMEEAKRILFEEK